MGAIPDDVAAAIQECWPDDVVAEIDSSESYFYEIYDALERDLRRISGASLRWQTEPGDDDPDSRDEWQSYHVFFLVPQGDEFQFDAETETTDDVEDPDEESEVSIIPGSGWYGCAVSVSLVAPFAAMNPEQFCEFEDGSAAEPDLASFAYVEETGERVDLDARYQEMLGETAFAKLDGLRAKIAAVLEKHRLRLLDPATLDLPAPKLGLDEGLFLEAPLAVRDAFFFRGA